MSQSLVQYFQTSGNIFLISCAIEKKTVGLMNFFPSESGKICSRVPLHTVSGEILLGHPTVESSYTP